MTPTLKPNAEFWGCDNSETLNYLPFQSKCELRCQPGYRNTGPSQSQCGGGGKVKGYEQQVCVKMAPEDIDEHEKALIDQSKPLELLLTEV